MQTPQVRQVFNSSGVQVLRLPPKSRKPTLPPDSSCPPLPSKRGKSSATPRHSNPPAIAL